MGVLQEKDRERIRKAIGYAESRTYGEIVPLVVKRSVDLFLVAPFFSSFGFSIFVLSYLFWMGLNQKGIDPFFLSIWGVLGAGGGGLFSFWPTGIRLIFGKKRLAFWVHQRALFSFLDEGLTQTKDRIGVLIFISLFEKRVEILGDQGIHKKVTDEYWKNLADQLALSIKEGNLVGGLEKTILDVSETLAQYFPKPKDDQNELPDEVITKE